MSFVVSVIQPVPISLHRSNCQNLLGLFLHQLMGVFAGSCVALVSTFRELEGVLVSGQPRALRHASEPSPHWGVCRCPEWGGGHSPPVAPLWSLVSPPACFQMFSAEKSPFHNYTQDSDCKAVFGREFLSLK